MWELYMEPNVAANTSEVYSLEELLEGVTSENLHEAISTGPAVGNEAW